MRRPHTMSFTTLEAVNFVFVRIETADGLTGWGEAACLGGPTWSEETAESVVAIVERYVRPWLVGRDATQIEALRQEMARRIQGSPFARAAVEMALWDLAGRALGVPVHRLLGGRVRDCVDEPSAGLAPVIAEQVYGQLLAARARGVTILLVDQSITKAVEIPDYLYVIERGRVHREGPREAFVGELREIIRDSLIEALRDAEKGPSASLAPSAAHST